MIIAVPRHARDLLYQIYARVVALTEKRIAAIQAGVGNFGDEKLRAIRARAGVRVG